MMCEIKILLYDAVRLRFIITLIFSVHIDRLSMEILKDKANPFLIIHPWTQ